ncbi:Protein of unknown function [Chitinophaga sp. CF118]|uniref:DUF2911 domain-containing protein n=1 Tax=Chitinophaga sp. CF118 TaxID=1884367 RepID=UPI0008F2C429|nr:DUF2911 domain-containing protein [Chitinophaga sp. CF118]SFD30187.1 Protein of unknown function [Chitinophaga sp. CF118]
MKKILFTVLFITGSIVVNAQDKKLPPLDSSPMDMAYYPVMYPYVVRVKGDPGQLVARVIYSRPQKKGRKIFGDLEPYGELYRLGANEATEIEFYRAVTIGGKNIPKGRYTMYSIPNEKTWTLIINRDTDIWGAFKYDKSKDVVRTDLPVTTLDTPVDPFTMVFEKAPYGANLIIAWDIVSITVPVKWSEKAVIAEKKK